MNNITVVTYKGFTKKQLEEIFDSLNMFGMESLVSVIEAWQYEHEEDGSILKEAFDTIFEEKERNQDNSERNYLSDREGLRNSLIKLSDSEFEFIGDLLELDPDDVFTHNPVNEWYDEEYDEDYSCDEEYDEEPYIVFKGIYAEVEDERAAKAFIKSKNKRTNQLFNSRFNQSLDEEKKKRIGQKSTEASEAFSKRYTKSLNATKKKDRFRPYSF